MEINQQEALAWGYILLIYCGSFLVFTLGLLVISLKIRLVMGGYTKYRSDTQLEREIAKVAEAAKPGLAFFFHIKRGNDGGYEMVYGREALDINRTIFPDSKIVEYSRPQEKTELVPEIQ